MQCARGEFGSPTFFVGDEMFFGKDRLREGRGSRLIETNGHTARREDRV